MVPPMGERSYEVVTYEVADGVATVTLNNPEKRNMLSGQMLTELVDAMKRAKAADEVRAVVLTGAGDKAFCAGADLGGFAADVPLVAKHFASDLFLEFFRLMPRLGKPIALRRQRPRPGRRDGPRPLLRPGDRQGGGHLRHAGDQRRRLPLHDHVDHLPQRPAQEGQRDDAAGRAALGRAGGRVRPRQQGRPGGRVRRRGRRVGGQARLEEPGADAPRPRRDVPPAGHGASTTRSSSCAPSSPSPSPPRTSSRASPPSSRNATRSGKGVSGRAPSEERSTCFPAPRRWRS